MNFGLNDKELQQLIENGFFIKAPEKEISFLKGYAELYSNDMPCLITIDSLIKVFSVNYKVFLKKNQKVTK